MLGCYTTCDDISLNRLPTIISQLMVITDFIQELAKIIVFIMWVKIRSSERYDEEFKQKDIMLENVLFSELISCL